MTLLVIFEHQNGNYQLRVSQKQLFHGRAMIKQLLDDSSNFGSVFEVGSKQINVEYHVDQRYFSRWIYLARRWRVTTITLKCCQNLVEAPLW